jgi:hypothetical protein
VWADEGGATRPNAISARRGIVCKARDHSIALVLDEPIEHQVAAARTLTKTALGRVRLASPRTNLLGAARRGLCVASEKGRGDKEAAYEADEEKSAL